MYVLGRGGEWGLLHFLGWPKHPPPNETGFQGSGTWSGCWGGAGGYFPAGIALWCLGIRLTSRNLLDP